MSGKPCGAGAARGRSRAAAFGALLAGFAALIAAACGSDDTASQSEVPAASDAAAIEAAPVLVPDLTLTVDDLVSAGWKKSKQYSTDTLPGAVDSWYGFFNQRDVEVWFYPTHQDALTSGVDSADEALGRKLRQGGQTGASNRGAGSSGVTRYEAYLIAGNAVMLCELAIENCIDLVDAINGS